MANNKTFNQDKLVYKGGYNFIEKVIIFIIRSLLNLRYKLIIKGLDDILQKGKENTLLLPNHIALIDPVLVYCFIHPKLRLRSIVTEKQVQNPIFKWLVLRAGGRIIPDIAMRGSEGRELTEQVLQESIEGLKEGENLLIYPSGRLKRQKSEIIGANSGVSTILNQAPNIRVVLLRQNGLWGSSLSWGQGTPSFNALKKGFSYVLKSFIFFVPKRKIEFEFVEPNDFPKNQDHLEINQYLENFYNQKNQANTYVPYSIWEKDGTKIIPEPETKQIGGSIEDVPVRTQELIINYLKELIGVDNVKPEHRLSYELGMDSIMVAETLDWISNEFGFNIGDTESYQTVLDLMLSAVGKGIAKSEVEVKPPTDKWYLKPEKERCYIPNAKTITEALLITAKKDPKRLIIADQNTGEKSYQDIILGCLVLKPYIEKIKEDKVGLMFPASVGVNIFYFATLFAGKTPVMINWTTGIKNVLHGIENVGVKTIITSKLLISKLESQIKDLDKLKPYFFFVEDLRNQVSTFSKIKGLIQSKLSWSSLRNAKVQDIAVILFTSGSESAPKTVPLTHKNILANINDMTKAMKLYSNDNVLGILPPFHSFGITVTLILTDILGMQTTYYPNPTESGMLAKIIQHYKPTFLLATPTFLNGILRASDPEQLSSLRLVITGAEKCPIKTLEQAQKMIPNGVFVEGYGQTECSPVICVNDETDPKPGTIGKILPSLEYQLVHPETKEKVGYNEIGILYLKGDSIFSGYLNHKGNSPFVELNGNRWYITGDLMEEDESNVITFSGRLKRFIKIGGEMISLPAIEETITPHLVPDDTDVPLLAVVATPNEENPEIILFSVLDIQRSQVNEIIRSSGFSGLYNIKEVIKIDEIPLLGTGKTDYKVLTSKLSNK